MAKNEVDFFRASWIGDYPDAGNFLALYYGKKWCSLRIIHTLGMQSTTDCIWKVISARSDAEAEYLYRQGLEQVMLNESPVVPLFYDELIRFTGKESDIYPVIRWIFGIERRKTKSIYLFPW